MNRSQFIMTCKNVMYLLHHHHHRTTILMMVLVIYVFMGRTI